MAAGTRAIQRLQCAVGGLGREHIRYTSRFTKFREKSPISYPFCRRYRRREWWTIQKPHVPLQPEGAWLTHILHESTICGWYQANCRGTRPLASQQPVDHSIPSLGLRFLSVTGMRFLHFLANGQQQ